MEWMGKGVPKKELKQCVMCRWFKHIIQNKDMQCTLQKKNPEEYENVKQMWKPIVRSEIG